MTDPSILLYQHLSRNTEETTNYYYVEKHIQSEPFDVNYKEEKYFLVENKMEREDIEKLAKLENTVEQHDKKLDTLEDIARNINENLNSINSRLGVIETKLTTIEENTKQISDIKEKLENLSGSFNTFKWAISIIGIIISAVIGLGIYLNSTTLNQRMSDISNRILNIERALIHKK